MKDEKNESVGFILVALNVFCFFLVNIDKVRTIRHQRRVPEQTLFMLAFLGGALGVYLGMMRFRHKTKHLYFAWGMVLLMALHGVIIYYLLPG